MIFPINLYLNFCSSTNSVLFVVCVKAIKYFVEDMRLLFHKHSDLFQSNIFITIYLISADAHPDAVYGVAG